jgi:hypothetical protein
MSLEAHPVRNRQRTRPQNFAGSIDAGRRQIGIAQSGRNEVALNAGNRFAPAPAYATVGGTEYVDASAFEGHDYGAVWLHDGFAAESAGAIR